MHELWICQNILKIVQAQARQQKCVRVKVIYLEVGKLAMIDKSALLFGFDVLAKDTIAENAVLKFIDVDGLAWCEACQKSFQVHRYGEICKNCGSFSLTIKTGEELQVKSMEIV